MSDGDAEVVNILMNMEVNPFHEDFGWMTGYEYCHTTNCPNEKDIAIRDAKRKKGNWKFRLARHSDNCPVTLLRNALTELGYGERK